MINIGIIGVGYWGPNLVRNFYNNKKCRILKICDLSPGRLEFIKSLYKDIELTQNSADIINNDLIDAVVIATPVNTHKELALKSLENNKHVFVEKPFTDKYSDGLILIEAAKQKNKILAVGHIFQFAPAVVAMKENIDKGLLGVMHHFSSQRINLGPPKTTVDVVWDLAPHDLSILLYLFNEFPQTIYAFGNSYWWKDIIDNAHIFMEFNSGKTAHINVSWLSSNKIRKTYIFGETGNLEYDETRSDENKVIFYDKGIDNRINLKDNEVKNLQYGKGEVRNIKLDNIEPLAAEVEEFINCIENNTEPINNGLIGCEVVKILEEATKSIKKKI